MIKVLTSGTFDLIHYGHINLLRRAKALGDYLVVACSTNECVASKGKQCYFDYEIRKDMLYAIRYVDLVIPETATADSCLSGLIDIVKEYHIDVFAIGSDYCGKLSKMKDYDKFSKLVKIVYLERTPSISTTMIKHDLKTKQAK